MKANDLPREHNGREVIFTSLVGSRNYNLHNEDSDYDFKSFLMPTKQDLFGGKMVQKSNVSEAVDVEYKDIRDLPRLLYKSNINFTEVLFTQDIWINPKYKEWIELILLHKDDFAQMNIPYWFNSSMGIFNRMQKEMYMETKGGFNKEIGYDPKAASKAIRVVNFLARYQETMDFGEAIWYPTDTMAHTVLMELKSGDNSLSREDMAEFMEDTQFIGEELKEWYMSQAPNTGTVQLLESILMDLIFKNI